MSPICRLATLEDTEQLIRLRVLMQLEVHGLTEADVPHEYAKALRDYFHRSLRDRSYVSAVAVVDGDLVSANGLVFYDKPPSLKGKFSRIGYVSNVYTLPQWRRRGLAGKLLQVLINYAKTSGVDKLQLGATDAGLSVYEQVGFRPVKFPSLELPTSE